MPSTEAKKDRRSKKERNKSKVKEAKVEEEAAKIEAPPADIQEETPEQKGKYQTLLSGSALKLPSQRIY
jgi:hypothetical protein